MGMKITIVRGNIALQTVDAIVNAANHELAGGGGVDGAIHRAAGRGLMAECRTLGGCPTGEARITGAYELAAKFVIHAVGPIWRGGAHEEDALLASCYRHALRFAGENQVRSVAFPAISTGTYGFPVERADEIALRTIVGEGPNHPALEEARLVCFGASALATMQQVAKRLGIAFE